MVRGMYGGGYRQRSSVVFVTFLGLIVFIASGIGLIVVSIVKLVYLYRTAMAFRTFTV